MVHQAIPFEVFLANLFSLFLNTLHSLKQCEGGEIETQLNLMVATK